MINIRGHQFLEVSNHTPSNCDVCNKTLSWSVIRGGEGSYECKREFGREGKVLGGLDTVLV